MCLRQLSDFSFQNTDSPTEFDALVDFIIARVEPLYVPWLHTRNDGETPGANLADDGDSDEEHLPGIRDMNKKAKKLKQINDNQETKDDSMDVTTDSVNLQGASGSAVNLPDTNNSQVTGDATINKAGGKRRRRRRSRKSSKTKQNGNVGLVYLRPYVKSFDVTKDKGNQAK